MTSIRVVVHKNELGAIGKIIVLKGKMDFAKLKAMAGKKLSVKAKRIFQADGTEIDSLESVHNNDQLYVSTGAPFYKESAQGGTKSEDSFSISVLGTGGVGKSALTLRFIRDIFVEEWDPTIEDAYRKTFETDDKMCTVEILDTAGQDDFLSLRPQWMIEKDAYVFVYSKISENSVQELEHFFELHQQINQDKKVPIILVANKKDLVNSSKEVVSQEAGMKIAQRYRAKYIETSAFSGENVEEVFKECIRQIREVRQPTKSKRRGIFSFCDIL